MQKVNRSEFTGLEIVSVVVIGLENRVSAIFAASTTPTNADVQPMVAHDANCFTLFGPVYAQ